MSSSCSLHLDRRVALRLRLLFLGNESDETPLILPRISSFGRETCVAEHEYSICPYSRLPLYSGLLFLVAASIRTTRMYRCPSTTPESFGIQLVAYWQLPTEVDRSTRRCSTRTHYSIVACAGIRKSPPCATKFISERQVFRDRCELWQHSMKTSTSGQAAPIAQTLHIPSMECRRNRDRCLDARQSLRSIPRGLRISLPIPRVLIMQ